MSKLKTIAALGAAAAVLLTGCGGKTAASVTDEQRAATALTINDRAFTAQEYAIAYEYSLATTNLTLSYYGMTLDQLMETEEAEKELRTMAQEQLTLIALADEKCEEAGIEVTDEDIDATLETTITNLGGQEAYDSLLADAGMTAEQFRPFVRMSAQMSALEDYYLGENGVERPSDEELRAYFDENYLRCKHVLIKTVDDNNQPLENADELLATAQDVAARAKAGEDFDALIAEYGEDPGMESNPDGYVFTEGEMVTEFYEGTKALEVNGISDPIESTYGYHIIQRLPLRDEDFNADTVLNDMRSFNDILTEWVDGASVTEGDELANVTLETAPGYVKAAA